jgi:uncharacterized protein YbbK (DUF523 family)
VADSHSKILISACLLGQPVRYDGKSKALHNSILNRWHGEGRLVPVCPEMSGGLPVPRPAAEINACRAEDILDGRGYVMTEDGEDVSRYFLAGARHALGLCRQHNIAIAILKENSPSCATTHVHDGGFSSKLIPGAGITTALLRRNGIHVFSEQEIDAAAEQLESDNYAIS